MVDINLVFEDLKANSGTRQARSLTILNDVLKDHHAAGGRNFSIAEIARQSVTRGGPTASTIRNATGLVFRQLIEAWAAYAGAKRGAASSLLVDGGKPPKDYELLTRIPDPALRAVFGQIIAERNRYRNELNALKVQSEFVIDKRPNRTVEVAPADQSVQVITSFSGLLNEMECEALKAAVSDTFFERFGWQVSRAGQVKDDVGEIYKHGYVNAIKKILNEVG